MEADDKNIIGFQFPIRDKSEKIIKVIGVGGGGGNAVQNMCKTQIHNATFVVCNTDSQALANSQVPMRIQLGDTGLGVGGKVEKGRQAALDSQEQIAQMLDDGTQMVFITAGMGGGTGTGAAPVIAQMARERGILTVGVVTLPFAHEMPVRMRKALAGLAELKKNVDALLVTNNERLLEIYSEKELTSEEGFAKADEILTTATRNIAEIITKMGIVNRDFCDVQTVMHNSGNAIMVEGRASGEHRLLKAFENALSTPLVNNIEIEKAKRILYILYTCDDKPIMLSELREINKFMAQLAPDVEVLWGQYRDNSLGEDVKVTLIATGFEREQIDDDTEEEDKDEQIEKLWEYYYGPKDSGKNSGLTPEEETETPDTPNDNDAETSESIEEKSDSSPEAPSPHSTDSSTDNETSQTEKKRNPWRDSFRKYIEQLNSNGGRKLNEWWKKAEGMVNED